MDMVEHGTYFFEHFIGIQPIPKAILLPLSMSAIT